MRPAERRAPQSPGLYASAESPAPRTGQLPATAYSSRFPTRFAVPPRSASPGPHHQGNGRPAPAAPPSPKDTPPGIVTAGAHLSRPRPLAFSHSPTHSHSPTYPQYTVDDADNGQTGMLLRITSSGVVTVAGVVPGGAADRSKYGAHLYFGHSRVHTRGHARCRLTDSNASVQSDVCAFLQKRDHQSSRHPAHDRQRPGTALRATALLAVRAPPGPQYHSWRFPWRHTLDTRCLADVTASGRVSSY